MLINIQRAIISTYLEGETRTPELLDEYYFDRRFRFFVLKINEFITREIPLSILQEKLEEKLDTHPLGREYIEIIMQYPLTDFLLEKYYSHLKDEKRKQLLKSVLA